MPSCYLPAPCHKIFTPHLPPLSAPALPPACLMPYLLCFTFFCIYLCWAGTNRHYIYLGDILNIHCASHPYGRRHGRAGDVLPGVTEKDKTSTTTFSALTYHHCLPFPAAALWAFVRRLPARAAGSLGMVAGWWLMHTHLQFI